MKNIHTILSEIGISIPDDKKADFDKAVAENYKTSAEFEKKVNRLTDDLETEKKRADTAVETLKGFEGKDFDAITRERDEWKKKHDDLEASHKKEQERMTRVTVWVHLEDTVLSEISQTLKVLMAPLV